MARYYEVYKSLILTVALLGVYFSAIEKIYGKKFYIRALKMLWVLPGISLPLYVTAAVKYAVFDADTVGSRIFGWGLVCYSSLFCFSYYSFFCLRYDLEKLFELWDSMFQEELFPESRQELLKKGEERTKKWLKTFASTLFVACLAYCTTVYFNPSKKLNHPSGLPYRNQSPDFELINTFDLIVSAFGSIGLITFDLTIMALISMEEAQLRHLKRSLGWIVDGVSVTVYGEIQIKSVVLNDNHSEVCQMKEAFEEAQKKLRIWISHHQQVWRFHREFQKAYSIPLSGKFSFFVLILCVTSYLALTGDLGMWEICYCIVFCVSNYTVFYVIVMYADSVAELGSSIFGEGFAKNWHLYPQELKTWFHIIQIQSNTPMLYKAFKRYPLCSESFLKIFTYAYSLFTLLLRTSSASEKIKNH